MKRFSADVAAAAYRVSAVGGVGMNSFSTPQSIESMSEFNIIVPPAVLDQT